MTHGLPGAAYAPPLGPVHALHADDRLLLVEKPAGLLSVPGKGPDLADCLLARLERDWHPVRLIHRLDRDTSGVMVFARTAGAQRHLARQFQRRAVEKTYIAHVAGRPAPAGRVDLPLAADWPNRPRQRVDPVGGKPAFTRWERLGPVPGGHRVVLIPLTGRSHQLRVHMATLGHPILGDPLYDGPPALRLMLHAESLRLRHPDGGAWMTFTAPCPF